MTDALLERGLDISSGLGFVHQRRVTPLPPPPPFARDR
jgi:hypothetical protein